MRRPVICSKWGSDIFIYILPHYIITYFYIFVKAEIFYLNIYKDKDDDHGVLCIGLGEPIAPHTRHPCHPCYLYHLYYPYNIILYPYSLLDLIKYISSSSTAFFK